MWIFIIFKFRIHTGGGEELHSYMNKDILPNEWGGKAGTLDELNGLLKFLIVYMIAYFRKLFLSFLFFYSNNIFRCVEKENWKKQGLVFARGKA